MPDPTTATLPPAATRDPEADRLRLALALARHAYADLLAAARAALAAEAEGDPDPLFWLRDELDAHGQIPPPGAVPEQVAAQTHMAVVT